MRQTATITIQSFGERLYTAKELRRAANVSMNEQAFAYLRDVLRLIPKPIKASSGRGVQGYYPKFSVPHLVKIGALRQKGRSYPQIAAALKKDTQRLFERWDELRQNYEFEKDIRRRLARNLVVGGHPDFLFKGSEGVVVFEAKVHDLKEQLKGAFRKWDGRSSGELKRIRGLIDRVQETETAQRLIVQTKGNSA